MKPAQSGSRILYMLHFLKRPYDPYQESAVTNPNLQIRKLRPSKVKITFLTVSTGKPPTEDSTDSEICVFHLCPKRSLQVSACVGITDRPFYPLSGILSLWIAGARSDWSLVISSP